MCVGLVKSLLRSGVYVQCLVQADRVNTEAKGHFSWAIGLCLLGTLYVCFHYATVHMDRFNVCISIQTSKLMIKAIKHLCLTKKSGTHFTP